MSNNAGITTWTVFILAVVYLIVANIAFVNYSNYLRGQAVIEFSALQANCTGNCSVVSSSNPFISDQGVAGTFSSLYITTTEELPWWVTTFFVILPDIFLPMILLMIARGIW